MAAYKVAGRAVWEYIAMATTLLEVNQEALD